jgi:DNA-binding NarL/FixJ family response regulator
MTNSTPIRIFSVDDHPLLHEGLAMVIRHQPDMVMVGEAARGQEAIERFQEYMPDVTLMDFRLPDMSGVEAMITIRSRFPDARVIILTTFANGVEIQRALDAGAWAYLLKTMPPKQLVETIRQVHAGEKQIPPEIAAHLAVRDPNEATTRRTVVSTPNRDSSLTQTPALPPGGNRMPWLSRLFRRK